VPLLKDNAIGSPDAERYDVILSQLEAKFVVFGGPALIKES
jgi:hypothetical protein